MSNTDLVREYLDHITKQNDLDRLRAILAHDFQLDDPMMGVSGADAFVDRLRAYQGPPLESTTEAVIGEGDEVVARTVLTLGAVSVTYAQWVWLEDGKIKRVQTIYDPRPFLEMAASA